MSVAQLWPRTSTRSWAPSSPRLWRRISAPVSWRTLLALGERGGRLLEVDPIDLDPAVARSDERAGLLGELGDLGGSELDVVEQHGPRHVAELVGADDGVRRLGEEPEHRRRLAARHRRHADVEPDGGEHRTGRRHQLPGLVLGQRQLTAPRTGGPSDRREGPTQPVPLGGERVGRRAPVEARRRSERGSPAPVAARTETSQTPALAGRIELNDELRARRRRDAARPALEAWAASSMSRFGAWNGEPSMPAITASCMSRGERTDGGAAGSSIRSTPSPTIASTTAVRTAVVVARPLSRPMIATGARHGGREGGDGRGVHAAPAATGPRPWPVAPVVTGERSEPGSSARSIPMR